jgi:hypothetical protein
MLTNEEFRFWYLRPFIRGKRLMADSARGHQHACILVARETTSGRRKVTGEDFQEAMHNMSGISLPLMRTTRKYGMIWS